MKCKQAKQLILLEPDSVLSERERRRLHTHLVACVQCAAYREKWSDAVSEIDNDSALSAAGAHVSGDFLPRLRVALAARSTTRPPSPADRLTRLLYGTFEDRVSATARALRSAAVAASILIAVICAASTIFSAPARPAPERTLGRIAAIHTTADADGRVYAALTQRRAVGYRDLREVYLK